MNSAYSDSTQKLKDNILLLLKQNKFSRVVLRTGIEMKLLKRQLSEIKLSKNIKETTEDMITAQVRRRDLLINLCANLADYNRFIKFSFLHIRRRQLNFLLYGLERP